MGLGPAIGRQRIGVTGMRYNPLVEPDYEQWLESDEMDAVGNRI
jgi:hypothetical protein